MSKKRKVTQDLLLRISRAEEVVSKWMHKNGIGEIDPEGCMPVLVNNNIYELDSKGRAHYFREDLRTLRDCNNLDAFSKLTIEQAVPGAKWFIKLKNNRCSL